MAQTLSKRRYPYITVGVVGGDGVGKTTFITSALDLSSPPSLPSTTKKMSLDGSVYLVCLLEIPTKEIAVEDDRIGWPRFGDGSAPAIDGVLVLHDPLQPATFTRTVRLLGMFCLCVLLFAIQPNHSDPSDSLSTSHIPFVVAASQPGPDPERDPVMANYQVLRAPSESSRSQKTCISAVLRLAIRSKNGELDPTLLQHVSLVPISSIKPNYRPTWAR